jgi:hypothetical protein
MPSCHPIVVCNQMMHSACLALLCLAQTSLAQLGSPHLNPTCQLSSAQVCPALPCPALPCPALPCPALLVLVKVYIYGLHKKPFDLYRLDGARRPVGFWSSRRTPDSTTPETESSAESSNLTTASATLTPRACTPIPPSRCQC